MFRLKIIDKYNSDEYVSVFIDKRPTDKQIDMIRNVISKIKDEDKDWIFDSISNVVDEWLKMNNFRIFSYELLEFTL